MKKCINLSIGGTRVEILYDPCPDYEVMGTYDNKSTPGAIIVATGQFVEDHPEDQEIPQLHNTCIFFHPPDSGEDIGSPDYRVYALQDFDRAQAYNRGDWGYLIISVVTTIRADKMDMTTEIRDSISGIESDGRDYIKHVINDLKANNKTVMMGYGFPESDIDKSLKEATITGDAKGCV